MLYRDSVLSERPIIYVLLINSVPWAKKILFGKLNLKNILIGFLAILSVIVDLDGYSGQNFDNSSCRYN